MNFFMRILTIFIFQKINLTKLEIVLSLKIEKLPFIYEE
jgi:hypothetical protein